MAKKEVKQETEIADNTVYTVIIFLKNNTPETFKCFSIIENIEMNLKKLHSNLELEPSVINKLKGSYVYENLIGKSLYSFVKEAVPFRKENEIHDFCKAFDLEQTQYKLDAIMSRNSAPLVERIIKKTFPGTYARKLLTLYKDVSILYGKHPEILSIKELSESLCITPRDSNDNYAIHIKSFMKFNLDGLETILGSLCFKILKCKMDLVNVNPDLEKYYTEELKTSSFF